MNIMCVEHAVLKGAEFECTPPPQLTKNKGIHLALVGSHCLSRLRGNRCHQNRVYHRPIYNVLYRVVGYIPVNNSHLHPTPQAPLNHFGVCLCDLMFGVKWGSHQGAAQLDSRRVFARL